MVFKSKVQALFKEKDTETKHAELETLALLREARNNFKKAKLLYWIVDTRPGGSIPRKEREKLNNYIYSARNNLEKVLEYEGEIEDFMSRVKIELSALRGRNSVSDKSFSPEERATFNERDLIKYKLKELIRFLDTDLRVSGGINRSEIDDAIRKIKFIERTMKEIITIIALSEKEAKKVKKTIS